MENRSPHHDRISALTREERAGIEAAPASLDAAVSPDSSGGFRADFRRVRTGFWVSLVVTLIVVGSLLITFSRVKHQFYERCIWGDDTKDPWCQRFSAMRRR